MLQEEIQPAKLKFKPYDKDDFYAVVKKRVHEHFKQKGRRYTGDWRLFLKAAIHVACYLLLTAAIFSDWLSIGGVILCYSLLGVTKGMIGFNIVHDALHNAFCSSPKLNRAIGYWFDFNGTSSLIWKISHNIHHHIYTNIPGYDGDIDKATILRLSPTDELLWFHRYQYIYAPFLYSLVCLNWTFYSDYNWFFKESKKRNIPKREIALFLSLKIANLIVFLALPMLLLSVPWWAVLAGFICMHLAAGIYIAIIFQLAHIVENVQYPQPNEKGIMANNWAHHEMLTTSNFATKNRFLTEMVGGLNFQIEHHLFSYISHVHYPTISKIVHETAKDFGMPYYEQPTLFKAVRSHFRTLRLLGTDIAY